MGSGFINLSDLQARALKGLSHIDDFDPFPVFGDPVKTRRPGLVTPDSTVFKCESAYEDMARQGHPLYFMVEVGSRRPYFSKLKPSFKFKDIFVIESNKYTLTEAQEFQLRDKLCRIYGGLSPDGAKQ